jgi:hypothetical protein
VSNCTLAANSGTDGGGIGNFMGTVTAVGCTLTSDSASQLGGGIENGAAGTMTVTNCTLTNNAAGTEGGGIRNVGNATVTNCTLAGNSSSPAGGGGVFIGYQSSLTLNNTIVAVSPSGGDVSLKDGTLTGSHNLVDDGSDGLPDTIKADPLLGPLANNGGPTQTIALLPGSPAIYAGSPALAVDARGNMLTTDQRGAPRFSGNDTVDIGAFESRRFTIAITSGNGQSTTVNTIFLNSLVVTVTSPYGDPVQGGVVTFTAPASGAGPIFYGGTATSVTATIDPAGQAAVAVAANTVAGSYAVVASATGDSFAAAFSLTNTPGAAAGITATAEVSQSTTVGYAFASPLQVLVTDAYGNPVPGVSVTFAAPTSGPSGSFSGGDVATTNAQGVAATAVTANTKAGSFAVTASVGGVGTPASFNLTNSPDVAAALVITAPTSVTQGTQFSFTVTAMDRYGNTATSYRGAVHLSSSDRNATLPANYTFVAGDNGVHTFPATMNTTGSQTLTVAETVTSGLTNTVTLTVAPKGSAPAFTTNRLLSRVPPGAQVRALQAQARHRAIHGVAADRHRGVKIRVPGHAEHLARTR